MVDSVKRNGPYAPLSANYAEDDAVMLLDLDEDSTAELLYVRSLAYSARDLSTEGFISDVAIRAGRVLRRKRGVVEKAAARLVEVGLWTREDDGYRVRSWLKWNKSWEVLTRKKQSDAERKAAERASTGTSGSVRVESARTDDGQDADSTRSPRGVAPPEALHVTSRQEVPPSSAAPKVSSIKADPPSFAEFWSAWPRRVQRKDAVTAYRKALKATTAETLLTAAQSYARSVQGRSPEHISHASSWLNGERWNDEQPPTPNTAFGYTERAVRTVW